MFRWISWVVYLVLMSLLLTTPYPARAAGKVPWSADLQLTASKSLHVVLYLMLAIFSATLPVARPRRWILLAVMSCHAAGTELVQSLVPARFGTWQDVALNHLGLYLGVLISWRWWIRD